MKIDRIYIGDFGIFKNAIMNDINSGMVIIGGRNRAGKSSFMEVLRNFPWGFQKSSLLPPPNGEYSIESDITCDHREKFNIKLQGYGEPKLYSLSGTSSATLKDIYNIDKYTYKELYTISLDELNNISKSDGKLQAVLLGAGFKEAVHLPEIIKEFSKEAERIGGKRGNTSTKMFKTYSNMILGAVKNKEKAFKEFGEYTEKENGLQKTMEEIQETRKELEETENSIIVLDVLRENYSDIKRYIEIENRLGDKTAALSLDYDSVRLVEAKKLKERYVSLLKEYDENCNLFRKTVDLDLNFKDRLLENKSTILKLEGDISGFRERLRVYSTNKTKWEEDKKSIIIDIHRINEKFSGGFKEIMDIKCDNLEIGEFNKLEVSLREAEHSIDEWNNKRSGIISQIHIYEETKGKLQIRKKSPFNFIDVILVCLLVINVLSAAYGIMHNAASSLHFITLLCLFAVIGVFMLYMTKSKSAKRSDNGDMEVQLLRLKGELQACENSLKLANDKKYAVIQRIEYYRRILMLDENTSPLSIKDYLISLQNIKNRIVKLGLAKRDIDEAGTGLRNDVNSILNLLKKLGKPAEGSGDLESYQSFADKIEEIASWIPAAVSLETALKNVEATSQNIKELIRRDYDAHNIEEELDRFIGECIKQEEISDYRLEYEKLKKSITQVVQSERVRTGLSGFAVEKGADKPLLIFLRIYDDYSGIEEINFDYEKLKADKEMLKRKIDELSEKIQKLKNEINGILISDKIRNAQETIDNARGGMRPIAEKYAVYCAASFILNKIYKDFMDKTQNSLLKESSEVLESITGGEYVDILPPDEAQSIDFKTRLKDGSVHESSNSLSRATREQLFLSVRVNRIRQNEYSLPVLIDDSFVNFDSMHIKHSIEIINELSKTNQVFILTCHPYMVQYVSSISREAQYWKLEKGRFFESDSSSLKDYLSFH